ncbi:MAG TPA: hypothetical protein VEM76_06480 [Anaeromyxobacteraceae bacterium]|nr:hypothetical protein [Anaeromyxobacteraceae bacterium]
MSADPLRRLAWLRARQEDAAAGALVAALAALERAAAERCAAGRAQWGSPALALSGATLRLSACARARLRARAALAVEASARAGREASAAAEAHRRARQERELVDRARERREDGRRRERARGAEAEQDDRQWSSKWPVPWAQEMASARGR